MIESLTSPISTVVFDLGRVLVDIDFDAFPNALGLTTPEARAPFRRDTAQYGRLYEIGKLSTEEFLDRMVDVFRHAYTREHLLFAWNEIIRKDVPGMTHVIGRVQERHATAMLSNTSAAHFKKAMLESLTVGMIVRRFLSFEIGTVKPDPEIYRRMLRELGTDPARVLFIDDLEENITAAAAEGMHGLRFTSVDSLEKDLTRLHILPASSPVFPPVDRKNNAK